MQKTTSISHSKTVVSIFDRETAFTLAVLFRDEMIPAAITAGGAPLRWDIQVPSEFSEQASRLYEQWRLSDAELAYLATGDLAISGGTG